MHLSDEFLVKSKGFLEDAIELIAESYKKTKARKERTDLRIAYEELVKRDTARAGFRRWIMLR